MGAEWNKKNAERHAENCKRWRRANKEKWNGYSTEWRKNNPGKQQAARRKYYLANISSVRIRNRAYEQQLTTAQPDWADEFFMSEIYDLAARRTQCTGKPWEVDHIVPLKSKLVCGLHCEANLAVIPKAANRAKSNTHWPDMPA